MPKPSCDGLSSGVSLENFPWLYPWSHHCTVHDVAGSWKGAHVKSTRLYAEQTTRTLVCASVFSVSFGTYQILKPLRGHPRTIGHSLSSGLKP